MCPAGKRIRSYAVVDGVFRGTDLPCLPERAAAIAVAMAFLLFDDPSRASGRALSVDAGVLV